MRPLRIAVLASLLVSSIAPAFGQSNGEAWKAYTEKDKLDGSVTSADAEMRHTFPGGSIVAHATCDSQTLQIGFAYYGDGDKKVAFATSGSGGWINGRYRIDQQPVQDFSSRGEYLNLATARFSFNEQAEDDGGYSRSRNTSDMQQLSKSVLSPLVPQELRDVLHAKIIRFELPLANRGTEVVMFNMQDPQLHQFLEKCGFDLKSADAIHSGNVERANAAAKAEADAKDIQQYRASSLQTANDKRTTAVLNVCKTGGQARTLSGAEIFSKETGHQVYIFPKVGSLVEVDITEPSLISDRICRVAFAQDGILYHSIISTGFLTPAF